MTGSVAFRAYFNSFAGQNFKYVSWPTMFIDVSSY